MSLSRSLRRAPRLLVPVALLAVSTVRAQAPAAPAAPDRYAGIRHVNLGSGGSVWIGFGGQLRERAEAWSNFNFAAPPSADPDDIFIQTRLFLSADLHVTPHFRFFVQGKSAMSNNRSLLGLRRTVDVDEVDLQQIYAEARLTRVRNGALSFRVGRQEMAQGRERLVSPLEWANTRRTFEGVSTAWATATSTVTAFWTRPVLVRKYQFNRQDSTVAFYGVYATHRYGRQNVGADLYWLGLRRGAATFNGTTGRENRQTFGGRVWGPLRPTGALDYEAEAALQVGSVGAAKVRALMTTLQAGYTFRHTRAAPRLYANLDYASGDDSTGGDVQTFNQLFPLGHAYLGFLDVAGRQNIVDLSGGGSAKPWRNLTVAADYHVFRRASARDGMYGSGAPFAGLTRATTPAATSKSTGTELDVTLRYPLDRYSAVAFGYSHFWTGTFLRQSGPAAPIDWAYAMLTYTL